jgi:hypothetical protein
VNATKLIIETKDWADFGPKYKAPVIQFDVEGTLQAGVYLLGSIGSIEGNINDILLEGIAEKRNYLTYTDGKLYLNVEDMRAATSVVWNGTADSNIWDFGVTKNFLNDGQADYAGLGDDVVFDDTAENTRVEIKGSVVPKSVTFNNETKTYVLNGDSILGGGPITKNGKGTVTINTENRTGASYINNGVMVDRNATGGGCAIDIQSANSISAIKKSLVPHTFREMPEGMTTGAAATPFTGCMFPDVPNSHWASCDINKLAINNVVVIPPINLYLDNLYLAK